MVCSWGYYWGPMEIQKILDTPILCISSLHSHLQATLCFIGNHRYPSVILKHLSHSGLLKAPLHQISLHLVVNVFMFMFPPLTILMNVVHLLSLSLQWYVHPNPGHAQKTLLLGNFHLLARIGFE